MQYNREINGVQCLRDVYSEQFSTTVKKNYMVEIHSDLIVEGECPQKLSVELKVIGEQLIKWSKHFSKMKQVGRK